MVILLPQYAISRSWDQIMGQQDQPGIIADSVLTMANQVLYMYM